MAFSWFRKWRERRTAVPAASSALEPPDDDMAWFYPPADVHDPACWDRYWNAQAAHGLMLPLFDMFCFGFSDLVQCLYARGAKTVLCAGNGISQEPRALAAAGFQVTVMDISPVAMRFAEAGEFSPEDLDRFCTAEQRVPGGSVKYMVGDITDLSVCAGPFDAIIERLMLQLFPEAERGGALDLLASRLQPNGLFLSHSHDGQSRPPAPPVHHVERFFRERGWTVWDYGAPESQYPTGRVVFLQMSTG